MDLQDSFTFQRRSVAKCNFPACANIRASGLLTDVTIRAGDRSIRVHRFALAAGIPYFNAMFETGMLECRQEEITMEDVDPQALENVIDFLYTNSLVITTANVIPLLETSRYLLLDTVTNACFRFLTDRMSAHNVLNIRRYADLLNKANMTDTADRYIRKNFEEVSLSADFTNLPLEILKATISRDDLFIMSEEIVFEAVMRWVKAAQISRCDHLPDLLCLVRMPHLTAQFLKNRVWTEKLITSSSACRSLLYEAEKFHVRPNSELRRFVLPERYCTEKQHLKCAKLARGSGMYALCHSRNGSTSTLSFRYYDCINKKWSLLGDSQRIRNKHALYAVCTGQKIFVLDKTRLYVLDLQSLHFSDRRLDVHLRGDSGTVYLDNKVYFFGGSRNWSRRVHALDLQSGVIERVNQMLRSRIEPSAVLLGQHIYVTGGYFPNLHIRRLAERHNTQTWQIDTIAPMRVKRVQHGCAALREKIYVCGGYTTNANSVFFTGTAEVYDPVIDQWNLTGRMSRVKNYIGTVSYGTELYSFYDRGKKFLNVDTYDPNRGTWMLGKFASCHSSSCRLVAALVTNTTASLIDVSPGKEPPAEDDLLSETEEESDSDYVSETEV